jgi:hypothetical protein
VQQAAARVVLPPAEERRGKGTAMGQTGFEKAKTVLRVTSGNFLEMYDFLTIAGDNNREAFE